MEKIFNCNTTVSVLFMAYMQERTVRSALESILNQEGSAIEIIATDDGSTDNTFSEMLSVKDSYRGPHTLVLRKNLINIGLTASINQAVTSSIGEFIVIAAGDDISRRDRVVKLVHAWEQSGRTADMLHSSVTAIAEDETEIELLRPRIEIRSSPSALSVAKYNLCLIGASEAWTRRVWDRFGPLPEEVIAEDRVIVFRSALMGGILYVDDPLVYYRLSGTSSDSKAYTANDELFGSQLKWINCWRSCYISHKKDLDYTGLGNKSVRRACTKALHSFNFRLSLAHQPRWQRLITIAKYAALGRISGPSMAHIAYMYLFPSLYIRQYRNTAP